MAVKVRPAGCELPEVCLDGEIGGGIRSRGNRRGSARPTSTLHARSDHQAAPAHGSRAASRERVPRASWRRPGPAPGLTAWAMTRTMADLGAVAAMDIRRRGPRRSRSMAACSHSPRTASLAPWPRALPLLLRHLRARARDCRALAERGQCRRVEGSSAKVVRRAAVRLRLVRPDGSEAWSREEVVGPG